MFLMCPIAAWRVDCAKLVRGLSASPHALSEGRRKTGNCLGMKYRERCGSYARSRAINVTRTWRCGASMSRKDRTLVNEIADLARLAPAQGIARAVVKRADAETVKALLIDL